MVDKDTVIEEITEPKVEVKEPKVEVKDNFKKVIPIVNIQYGNWILEKWKEVKVPIDFYERIKHLIK